MIEDDTKEKTLHVELNREHCKEENIHKFLCLLKRRLETQADDTKEVREEYIIEVVKQSKKKHIIDIL